MPSFDYNVDNALQHHLQHFLIQKNYDTLRTHVLAEAPITEVVNSIKSELHKQHEKLKQETKIEHEQRMLERQMDEDRQEEKRDLHDAHLDEGKKVELIQAQALLAQRLRTLDTEIIAARAQIELLHRLDNQQHRHEHGHDNRREDGRGQNDPLQTRHEIHRLNRSLDSLTLEHRIANTDLERVTRELSHDMTQRGMQRQVRRDGRVARKQARNISNAPLQSMLSNENWKKLNSNISATYSELDRAHRLYITEANDKIYDAFLNQILQRLTTHQLSEEERGELRHQVMLMQKYRSESQQVINAKSQLSMAKNELNRLENSLQEKTRAVKSAHLDKPDFQAASRNTDVKIKELQNQSNVQSFYTTVATIIGVVALVGITGFFVAVPIALPIVACIIAGISLGYAGYSAYQNYKTEQTIKQHQAEIYDNQSFHRIENVDIPELEQSIIKKRESIGHIENQISIHEQKRDEYRQQAEQIMPKGIVPSMVKSSLFSASQPLENVVEFQPTPTLNNHSI